MGNKPARKMGQQPYNQMVEDAIAALKERPGSTKSDIFQYLEAKYESKISPKSKRDLETVIRSVIKSKTRGGGRQPLRGFGRRRGGFKAKGGPRSKFGRGLPRGRTRSITRLLGPNSKEMIPKPHMTTLKPGKKSAGMPKFKSGFKSGGHQRQQLLRKAKRGSKLLLRPARRTTSIGSMSTSLPLRRGRRN